MLLFVHCQDTSVTHWFSKASESFILLNSKEHTSILMGWQERMYFTDTHLGVKFRLRNETSVPSLLPFGQYISVCISVLLYTLSNTIICHSRIKALEHMHNAYISPPLPAHSTNPLRFASHKLHVPFYTAPYSIPFTCRQFVSSFPPWQDKLSLIL